MLGCRFVLVVLGIGPPGPGDPLRSPFGAAEGGCNQVAMNLTALSQEESSLYSPNMTTSYKTYATF